MKCDYDDCDDEAVHFMTWPSFDDRCHQQVVCDNCMLVLGGFYVRMGAAVRPLEVDKDADA